MAALTTTQFESFQTFDLGQKHMAGPFLGWLNVPKKEDLEMMWSATRFIPGFDEDAQVPRHKPVFDRFISDVRRRAHIAPSSG